MMKLSQTSNSVPFLLTVLIAVPAFAAIPLPSAPSWTSNDYDYSTGGALADVNGDDWLDFIISNGNDMATNQNGVYLNRSGALDTIPSWTSVDNGYFGHCYAGDVNNDGLPDLALAYLGSGTSGEKTARIYLNDSGTLGTMPYWKATDKHSSFDCCLGDVDLDGDIDLAISAGDAYASETDSVRIYRNNNGIFDTLPFWTAHEGTPSDAVRFCDIDNDGDLDLFVGQHNRISMYRNSGGTLEQAPSWVARTDVGWILRLALGDYDNDGWPDLAAACNDQLGDPNGVRVYHNSDGTLDTIASFAMLRADDYCSCVAWGDVNGDNYLDLAVGRWYGAVSVFANVAGVLDTTATWSWVPTIHSDLVCEAVVWGDLVNGHLSSVNESNSGDGTRKLFNIHRRPLQALDSVYVDGARAPVAGYCLDLLGGWVSLAAAPPAGINNVAFFYRFSEAPDLAVTNWDQSHGNHVFLNTTPAGIATPREQVETTRLAAWPNPFKTAISLQLTANSPAEVAIFDAAGRRVRSFAAAGCKLSAVNSFVWDGRDEAGRPVTPGVYFAAPGSANQRLKLIRVSQN
jgi:hypothetical protein